MKRSKFTDRQIMVGLNWFEADLSVKEIKTAMATGILLKQIYVKEDQQLRRKAGGYAHAC